MVMASAIDGIMHGGAPDVQRGQAGQAGQVGDEDDEVVRARYPLKIHHAVELNGHG